MQGIFAYQNDLKSQLTGRKSTRPTTCLIGLVMLMTLTSGVEAVSINQFARAFAGQCSAGACDSTGLVSTPVAEANASYVDGGFSVLSSARTEIDDSAGLKFKNDYLLAGNFNPDFFSGYLAEISAGYQTNFTISILGGGSTVPQGTGTVRFRFNVDGRMKIDGSPEVNLMPIGTPQLSMFNQLRIRVNPNSALGDEALLFREDQMTTADRAITINQVSDWLEFNFDDDNVVEFFWQGAANVRYYGGDITLESMFGNTAVLTGVEVRDSQGNLLNADVLDDLGRSLVAPIPVPAPIWLLFSACGVLLARDPGAKC